MNRIKKRTYYRQRISDSGQNSKKLWNVRNEIMDKRTACSSFIESDGIYLTKPFHIANYFNDYFVDKVSKIRWSMNSTLNSNSEESIKECIMNYKTCTFEFHPVDVGMVERLLKSLTDSKSTGIDHLEGKLLRKYAPYVSTPVCHIFNRCLISGVFPMTRKEWKIIPLPKDATLTFNGPNSRPTSILPVLSKVFEKIMFGQIQFYFSVNDLTNKHQHAYQVGYSTYTALTQMSDSLSIADRFGLSAIDRPNLLGAEMLDFSAAFDVIYHDLLIHKPICYGFKNPAVSLLRNYLSSRS